MKRKSYKDYDKPIPNSTLKQINQRLKLKNQLDVNNNVVNPNLNIYEIENTSILNAIIEVEPQITEPKENETNLDLSVYTKLEITSAFISTFFSAHLSQTAANLILKFFNLTRTDHDKIPPNFNSCLNYLKKSNNITDINYQVTYFCEICLKSQSKEENNKSNLCRTCDKKISTYYHLDIEEQIICILKNNPELLESTTNNRDPSKIADIVDSQIYKNLFESEDRKSFETRKAFTFLLNTDGILMSEKSHMDVWPIYLVINELSIEKRFAIENTVIGAISVGENKPNFCELAGQLINKLKKLELGIKFNCNYIKFFTIMGVFDKPARAAIINLNNSNGYYSCLKCEQGGSNEETSKGGNRRIYCYNENDPTGPLRTKESYLQHLLEAISKKKPVKGIKGPSILRHLKYYHPIENTCIDYMHSVLLGVIKTFFKFWFESTLDKKYCLKKHIKIIDKRLSSIKPPTFIATTPRSIDHYAKWRAKEYLYFTLYYSLPVFDKIMDADIYANWMKLVIFLEIILSPEIKRNQLYGAQIIIQDFVKEVANLYDNSIMLSGVHELLHLVDCIKKLGPLNIVNCFQFEELNRKFFSFINGKSLIGEEFIKIFSIVQALNKIANVNNEKTELKQFINDNCNIKSSNTKRIHKDNNLIKIMIRSKQSIKDKFILDTYNNFFQSDIIIELQVIKKIKYKGYIYNSFGTLTKHDDSCIVTKDGTIAVIKYIFVKNEVYYFIAEKLVKLLNPYYSLSYPDIQSSIAICRFTDEIFIDTFSNIQNKLCFISFSVDETYVSQFNGSHLFV